MKQPNTWSCTPTAFAIVLGVDVQELISEVGHDGSEILWPMAAAPNNRRGFHIQELVEVCFNRGYGVIQIEPRPVIVSAEHVAFNKATGEGLKTLYPVRPDADVVPFMDSLLATTSGVLCGLGSHGNRHSVAWTKGRMIDPTTGEEIHRSTFRTQYYYIVQKLHFGLDVN